MRKKKRVNKAPTLAIVIVSVLCIVIVASVYAIFVIRISSPSPKALVIGVKVGDTFFYNITSESIFGNASGSVNPDSEYPGFSVMNSTKYFKVTITGINGSIVELNTDWVFNNGTDVAKTQQIDLANGNLEDPNGFWAIYASNLNVNDLLRPKGGSSNLIVNSTYTQTYASGTRQSDNWSTDNVFYNVEDPTGSTQCNEYMNVYFDKQTGILTTLTYIEEFNNPQMTLVVSWQISSSTEWLVS